ncbi:MAG: hypothetical protein DRJ52_07855 [Thermoprotei archaeon]|nr:MAG: hypothetical protein DRJ52_07855 [Thermoprotei archaeon]RLE99753.1 MAG: hypothetical protein DRJ63_04360 [Thermoprotei archaeon]
MSEFQELERLLLSARGHLERALDYLSRAETKSVVDMFFGGFVSFLIDLMEYEDYRKAVREIEYARSYLRKARKYSHLIPSLRSSDLWLLLDVAFDSFFTDLLRHFRIMEAKRTVEDAIREIDRALYELRTKRYLTPRETVIYGEEDTRIY